jgi:hypothetical protein
VGQTWGFETADEGLALAAQLVYAVYRSRDTARFKAGPEMWGQIERFVKDAAKRARTLPAFIEALKPRLACETINPRYTGGGTEAGARSYMVGAIESADARAVLQRLYAETAYVVLLVRTRLESERGVKPEWREAE